MISLPLQNNTNFGAGPAGETTTNDFNMQPVYPVGLGKVNLINRVILPISYQGEFVPDRPINPPPGVVPPDQLGTKSGLGDTTYMAYFSPASAGSVVWGAGPVLIFPTGFAISTSFRPPRRRGISTSFSSTRAGARRP